MKDFESRFNAKLHTHTADMSYFVDGTDEDWTELLAHLEGGEGVVADNGGEGGFVTILIAEFADEALDPKEMIQMVLDRTVENIESMVDTVDVFHLIAAHRDLPSLAAAVPFELASHVGYTFDEWECMCDEMDERLNEVLETAIDQMIGAAASENNCF